MIPEIRKKYNDAFTQEKYQAMIADMNAYYNYEIPFRLGETPVFLSDAFRDKVIAAGNEIVAQVEREGFMAESDAAIPPSLYVPNDPGFTGMIAIDFAICKDENGDFSPQLIEMQGFPSLYGYQSFCSEMYLKHFEIPEGFTYLFNGLTKETYLQKLKDLVLNGHPTENVVLLEIEPYQQKTAIDFYCTEEYTGVKAVCISEIIVEGRKLFYMNQGVKTPIYRIYNRVIFDELLPRTDLKRQFNLTEDVDVEWVTHPNWFFRISKFTLPSLKSDYVPSTYFLHTLDSYPADLENYVLKPLFSFAGQGVKINVTQADLDAVTDRENWILQKKVQYEHAFLDPDGVGVKAEIRLLYMYDKKLGKNVLCNNLGRLSKGVMIGVRYNKDFSWVGGSSYFFRAT